MPIEIPAEKTAQNVVRPVSSKVPVFLQQTAIGDYRQSFLDLFAFSLEGKLRVCCGSDYFYPSLRTGVRPAAYLEIISNIYLLQRRLLLQPKVIVPAVRASVSILELNPRILSNWVILLLRRLLRRRTILWGHAWPREGQMSRTDAVRNLMRKLADVIVVYTDSQREELAMRMPGKKIVAAPNALYEAAYMRVLAGQASRMNFTYVGRLVREKKVDLLLEAFAGATDRLPPETKLLIVGDGPERSHLVERAHHLGIEGRVEFAGHVADKDVLAAVYATTLASVSPGYVGLSITQSLGFGVPMIIADKEPHAPEIEAARPGFNSAFFEAGDAAALGVAMVEMAANRDSWINRVTDISSACKESYSAEAMAVRMKMAVSGAD